LLVMRSGGIESFTIKIEPQAHQDLE
jgi:hypothetical protein